MLIRWSVSATAGRVILAYTGVRQISISLGINLGGHAGAVRPVVAPLAEGAARARHPGLSKATTERIRAHAAAAENVGSFFGEDIFIAVGAILLMKGFFDALKIEVSTWAMALWAMRHGPGCLCRDGVAHPCPGPVRCSRGACGPGRKEYRAVIPLGPHTFYVLAGAFLLATAWRVVIDKGHPAAMEHRSRLGPPRGLFCLRRFDAPEGCGIPVPCGGDIGGRGPGGAPLASTRREAKRESNPRIRLGSRLFVPALIIPITAILGSLFLGRLRWHGVAVAVSRHICLSLRLQHRRHPCPRRSLAPSNPSPDARGRGRGQPAAPGGGLHSDIASGLGGA